MATIKDVEALGYTIGLAAEGVYVITGYGITNLYITGDDQVTIDSLADPALSAVRIQAFDDPPAPIAERAVVSQLAAAVAALKTLDQTKPATIGDVVSALKAIVS